MKTIKVYFQNSSLHGLHYIVDEKCSWIERLFWLVIVSGSCYFCYTMIMIALSVRLNVSYTVTTDYLNWETHFPAVSICPDYGKLYLPAYIPDMKKDFPDYYERKIYSVISAAIFGELTNMHFLRECEDGRIKGCPESGYRELYLKYQMNCSSIFLKCSWNDKPFDCCKYFKFFPFFFNRFCFTANNFLNTNEHYPMIYKNGQGIMEVVIKPEYFFVFVHSRYDSLDSKEPHELSRGSFSISLIMTDTDTDEDVIIAPIDKRGCRFKHEKIPGYHFPIYGPNLCIESCTIEYMLEFCNCTYASVPNILEFTNGKYCDFEGMNCVRSILGKLYEGNPVHNNDKNVSLSCPHCMPTCSETSIQSSQAIPLMMNNKTDYATLKIYISQQPYLRFKRSLVKNPLDLVVSIGGTMGLFLGASILSLMEFIYYFSIRLIN